ncbi:MAG: protein required for attachment to host cell [Caulobacter sp. 12-67-6]|nr:MAG: protein required for attachment to host cell [Caulobacter sp. 12-67-6]OYX68153.1 MAG: protein required for attachment to host cell [Caulobacter sp. 32-67-35]OZA74623.1 MAG: protein required for attachment to host cell [Caulobacter sp. 39-67-4]
MITQGRTLVVAADDARARLFEEPRRGGPLTERSEWLADLAPRDFPDPGSGGIHDRMGYAIHGAATVKAADKSARDFLVRLVARLDSIVNEQDFDHLVIFAPPRALGMLRVALPRSLRQRLALDQDNDRVDAGPEALREALSALRLNAS